MAYFGAAWDIKRKTNFTTIAVIDAIKTTDTNHCSLRNVNKMYNLSFCHHLTFSMLNY